MMLSVRKNRRTNARFAFAKLLHQSRSEDPRLGATRPGYAKRRIAAPNMLMARPVPARRQIFLKRILIRESCRRAGTLMAEQLKNGLRR